LNFENLFYRIARQEKINRSCSVDVLLNEKNLRRTTFQSTDSALYSMSDKNLTTFQDFFSYWKSKILTNKNNSNQSRKFLFNVFVFFFEFISVLNNKDEEKYLDFSEKTSLIKRKLIQREEILGKYQEQINQVNQQLLSLQENSSLHSTPPHYSSLYALELLL
jgi:hypothetical protein